MPPVCDLHTAVGAGVSVEFTVAEVCAAKKRSTIASRSRAFSGINRREYRYE